MFAAHRRRSRAGHLMLLALVATAFLPAPAQAAEGLYTQYLCADPATGQALAPRGELPDGMSNPTHYALMGGAGMRGCADEGIVITQAVSTTTAHTGAALTYRAGDVRFRRAEVYRYWIGSGAWGMFVNRGSWDSMWTSPWDERCSSNTHYNCLTRGTSSGRLIEANKVVLTAGSEPTNGFNLAVLCDSSGGGNETCRANSGRGLHFYGGTVTLEDSSAPQVSGTPSGDLYDDVVASRPLKGVRQLSIGGTDAGAGLYRVQLLLDDEVALSQVVDDNGGRCVDAIPTDEDPHQFLHRQPCRATAGGDYAFDTTKLAEGTHNLKVRLEDAAGNTTTALNRTITVDNVPPPSVTSAPRVHGVARSGSSLAVAPATFEDHGIDGEPTVTRVWQRCRADGSQCVDTAETGLTYTVADADLNRTLRVVETASNSEGSTQSASLLTDRVTRADGTLPTDNDGLDNDGDGTVDEPGETPSPTGPSAPGTGSSTVVSVPGAPGRNGTNGVTTTVTSLGAINGENASSRATLTATFARGGAKGSLAYGKTLAASGRLTDESGRPIRNAIIDVAETPALAGAKAASSAPAVTDSTGAFTYKATGKAGSRNVTFLYRYQREGAVVAHKTLALKVKAGVKLVVKLKGVTATYSGRVLAGSMPRGGKLVIVQGRAKGGSWQTFASRRAGKSGAFKGKYRLKVRRPGKQLQFRVRVLSESGWNYTGVTSKAVTRRVK